VYLRASVEVVALTLQIALSIALPALIVRWDMARLSAERLERAWNAASFWSSIVAFGPLCLPVHFVKTRRSITGFLLGAFWAALNVAVSAAVASALAAFE
jgi:hypothetical protein